MKESLSFSFSLCRLWDSHLNAVGHGTSCIAGALQLLRSLWAGLKGKQFFIKQWKLGSWAFFTLPFHAKSGMKRKYHIYNTEKDPEVMCLTVHVFQFFQLSWWRDKPCEVAMGACQVPQGELWMWASSFPSHPVVVCGCPVLSNL